jgi:hypothetical protein
MRFLNGFTPPACVAVAAIKRFRYLSLRPVFEKFEYFLAEYLKSNVPAMSLGLTTGDLENLIFDFDTEITEAQVTFMHSKG